MSFKKALITSPRPKNLAALTALVEQGAGVDHPIEDNPFAIPATAESAPIKSKAVKPSKPKTTTVKSRKPKAKFTPEPMAKLHADADADMVRVSMLMPADVHAELKAYCARNRLKLGAICGQWLSERLGAELKN